MYTHTHIYIYVYTYSYIYIYTCIYIYIGAKATLERNLVKILDDVVGTFLEVVDVVDIDDVDDEEYDCYHHTNEHNLSSYDVEYDQ